ncbi:hypothetical protein [Sutcliffiella halmapala]|uniref:hypothetical protein n=1 Tax=Sutcliffiella halmapala TaxID=79882 RepID=UPI001116C5DC|nr:hypothetical protein [Sutcliffiella halmapala]
MKKWIFSALLYLLIVVGAYTVYSFFIGDNTADHEEHQSETGNHAHEEDEKNNEHGNHGEHDGESASEVTTNVELKDGVITVSLEDKQGKPMDELEVNHEKLLHLIVISEDLENFYHLHPEKQGPGEFTVQADLEDGMYQAFVDIKPSNLEYMVEPKPVMIGGHEEHGGEHVHLKPETNWQKEIDEYLVTLDVASFSMKKNVVLSFEIEGATPENYLGALGHVVIVNEELDQFIHVHPASDEKPVFEAHFSEPGMYKLWAEFKLEGKVYAFPYVIEITE